MTCSERVSQWTQIVSSHFPHLSRPQAGILALWSLGMVLSRSCGLSQVSVLLALAVATLWAVGVGSQAEVSRPAKQLEQLPPMHVARQRAGSGSKGPRGRDLSCLTRGRLCVLAAVWRGEAWPQAALWPEAWPMQFPPARPLPAAKRQKQRKQRERQRVRRRNYRAARRSGKGKSKKTA
jgi:hypothetical protein